MRIRAICFYDNDKVSVDVGLVFFVLHSICFCSVLF